MISYKGSFTHTISYTGEYISQFLVDICFGPLAGSTTQLYPCCHVGQAVGDRPWCHWLMGSHLGTGSNPEWVFKDPMGRCKASTPSSLSLTSNRVTTNY